MNVKNSLLTNKFSQVIHILKLHIDVQKKIAHNAIDTDNWDELQKIIENISLINSWCESLKSIKDEISQSDIINSDNFTAETNSISIIVTFIESIIAEKKESVNSVLLMDDWEKGQELLTEIREQIFKIKSWVNSLKSIDEAISESEIIDFDIQKINEATMDNAVPEKKNDIAEEPDKENDLSMEKSCSGKAVYLWDGVISKSGTTDFNIQKKIEVIDDDIVSENKSGITKEFDNQNQLHNDVFDSKKVVSFDDRAKVISNPKTSELNVNIIAEAVTDSVVATPKDSVYEDTTNKNHLSIEDNFRSKKVVSFCFGEKKYIVKDLTEALIKICDLLYELDKYTFERMLTSPFVYGKNNLYLTSVPRGSYYQKMNKADIYVWTNTNSNDKIKLISHMMEYFNLKKNDLTFESRADYNPKKRVVSPHKEEKEIKSEEINNETVNDIIDIIIGTNRENIMPAYEPVMFIDNEQYEGEFDIISFCEENILKNPYLMAVINYDSEVGHIFTENEHEAKTNMKKPTQLSNGLWIDADITNISGKDIQQLKKLFS